MRTSPQILREAVRHNLLTPENDELACNLIKSRFWQEPRVYASALLTLALRENSHEVARRSANMFREIMYVPNAPLFLEEWVLAVREWWPHGWLDWLAITPPTDGWDAPARWPHMRIGHPPKPEHGQIHIYRERHFSGFYVVMNKRPTTRLPLPVVPESPCDAIGTCPVCDPDHPVEIFHPKNCLACNNGVVQRFVSQTQA